MNIINTDTVSVGDLFVGAMVPGGLGLAVFGLRHVKGGAKTESCTTRRGGKGRTRCSDQSRAAAAGVNRSGFRLYFIGAATPTEAAGVGATGALLLALVRGALTLDVLRDISRSTLYTTSMVFLILIGAAVFSLVFRGFGGDTLIEGFFEELGGGPHMALLVVMLVMFLLGFILDFIEITFVVVPVIGPILLSMGFDPIWLGVMIAVNLQTSFLTPPFGFALFYACAVWHPTA